MKKNVLLLLGLFAVGAFASKVQAQETLLDRTGWTVFTSTSALAEGAYEYVPDDKVTNGGLPSNLFDGLPATFFTLVKPGKSYAGCSTPADHTPYFIVDMKATKAFNLIRWQHRDNGGTESLRAWSIDIHGSIDGETFVALKTDVETRAAIPADIVFETEQSYRYLQFTYKSWHTSSSSTIQVGELNVGTASEPEEPIEPEEPVVVTPLDRTGWVVTPAFPGITDATVGGDNPMNLIDGDNVSSFLFAKPGRGALADNPDAEQCFVVNMQTSQEFNTILYRHRDHNNVNATIRASKGSLYGSADGTAFEEIALNFEIATNITEVEIPLPAKVSYKYVKFVFEAWNTSSGNTMQVSEFNLGLTNTSGMESIPAKPAIAIYPTPAIQGELVTVEVSEGSAIEVWDFSGRLVFSTDQATINTGGLGSGIYVVVVKGGENETIATGKLIVK